MKKFIFVATVFRGAPLKESIPVFGFAPGDAERGWESNEAASAAALTQLAYQAIGAASLTIAIPIPIAMQLFPLHAHFDKLWIFANDKPSDPYYSTIRLDFESLTVFNTKHIPKGTFKMEGSQFKTVPGPAHNMAMFTPQGVSLHVGG